MSGSATPTIEQDCTLLIDQNDIVSALKWNLSQTNRWKEFQFDTPLTGEITPRLATLSTGVFCMNDEQRPVRLKPTEFINEDAQLSMTFSEETTLPGELSVGESVILVEFTDTVILPSTTHQSEEPLEIDVEYTNPIS